jgi:hypothetical protein
MLAIGTVCCYALECWQLVLFVVMHWNVGNCTTKRTNINKYCVEDLIFATFCTQWAAGENVMEMQHYVHNFSR